MNRREFLQRAIVASTATTILTSTEARSKGVKWQIGCFNRPWTKWSFDQTLKEIKADRAFKDFPLVRISRLSVMPVSDAEWDRIENMAGKAGGAG